jgi:transketolase
MNDTQIKNLELQANAIRISIIDMLEDAGSGHTAGPLGMTDVFTAFYFHLLKHDPKNPDWTERDRLILSKWTYCSCSLRHNGSRGLFSIGRVKDFT